MENSNENIDTNVINLILTNLFCILQKYLNIRICKAACINITNRMLSNASNEVKNLAIITEQMNNMIKKNEFKCDKNLTKSFLQYIVIPDPDLEEWKTEQNKLCVGKNFITCNMPGDCKYHNSMCEADEAKYTLQKLEAMKQKNQEIAQADLLAKNEIERKQKELDDFNEYVNRSEDQDEWVDRLSKYCNNKNDVLCITSKNGCTMPLGSNKCIPDVKDYIKKNPLNYQGTLTKLEPLELEQKKAKRKDWIKMQDTICNIKKPAMCIMPNNDCKYENSKCSVDNEQYTDEKFTKMDNEKKAKIYLNGLTTQNEWAQKLTKYCGDKDYAACSTKNNACTYAVTKQKCEVDLKDWGKGDKDTLDKLNYVDNLEEIVAPIKAAEKAAAEKAASEKAASEKAEVVEVKPASV